MDQCYDNLEHSLENWRQGRASLDDVRSLALDIGGQGYSSGISALIELLDHEDEIVRHNAVVSLGFDLHFKPIAKKLMTMLLNDQDDDCRGAAAGALGNLCRDSKDRDVLGALGMVALNDSDEDVRISAYKALLSVSGLSREEHLKVLTDQKLPVDPERVEAILEGQGR